MHAKGPLESGCWGGGGGEEREHPTPPRELAHMLALTIQQFSIFTILFFK